LLQEIVVREDCCHARDKVGICGLDSRSWKQAGIAFWGDIRHGKNILMQQCPNNAIGFSAECAPEVADDETIGSHEYMKINGADLCEFPKR